MVWQNKLTYLVTSWFVCEMPEYFCDIIEDNHFWFMHAQIICQLCECHFSCIFPSGLKTLLYQALYCGFGSLLQEWMINNYVIQFPQHSCTLIFSICVLFPSFGIVLLLLIL